MVCILQCALLCLAGHAVRNVTLKSVKELCRSVAVSAASLASVQLCLLAHATGGDKELSAGEPALEPVKADAARWTLVSRLSSRLPGKLPGAQNAQGAQQGSASGHSTPSNLERAVLLLEAETESVSSDSKVSAVVSAVSSPAQPAGDREPETPAPGVIYAKLDDRQEGSSEPTARLQQSPTNKEPPRSAGAQDDASDSTELEEQQSALSRVNLGEDSKGGLESRDSLDEGPSTPPASSAAARADTKASSSPNSTAGGLLMSKCDSRP